MCTLGYFVVFCVSKHSEKFTVTLDRCKGSYRVFGLKGF